MKQRQNYKEIFIDTLFDIIGSFALAIGIYYFAEKANIAPGGVSGIAILIKYLWGLPIGTMTLVINIPIIYLAFRYLGKKFTFKTLRTLIISSIVIMSDKNEVIAGRVIEEMERSATFIKGQGAYSQKDALVLLCVVRIQEYHQLKTIVYNEDPTAFMIVTEADQVLGEGFKPITKQR